jgi:hypothetical protein
MIGESKTSGLEAKSVIENVRDKEDSLSLDTTGFQFINTLPSLHNIEEIRCVRN